MTGDLLLFPACHAAGRLLTKRQLATELGRSTRWVELRMREGMPVAPRGSAQEHTRFDLTAVRAWMDARAAAGPAPLEQRIAHLERQVARLAAALQREAS